MAFQDTSAIAQSVIADTVAAVFRAPEFNPRRGLFGLPSPLWWTRFVDFSLDPVVARWIGIGLLLIVVLAAVIVWLRGSMLDTARSRAGGDLRAAGLRPREAWNLAQQLAAAGDYTGAAHALHLALLGDLAQRDLLRLHPSKTIGDYLRELRRRPAAPVDAVREFARTYERVAYGLLACDAERYARLHHLAARVIDG